MKLVRRSDVFGIYAGTKAVVQAAFTPYRDTLDEAAAVEFADQTGCYVGSGGGAYNVNYATSR